MNRLLFLLMLASTSLTLAQKKATTPPSAPPAWTQFEAMKFRNIGPARGGRSTAVAGIASQPYTFFMGATGGGVWRTEDGGTTWRNVSDGFFSVGSIGSIKVAPSDANVIYVGTGSADPRGNVSIGKGLYKSTDGGKTWAFKGLEKGGQIGTLEVHPANADVVFAAVLGNPFGPSRERGIYRSRDGGTTWEQKLFINERTGAMDVVIDPTNPRIVYAAFWEVQRKPWTLIDGGPDGGVFKSVDGGDTWQKLSGGLPTGILGKISVAVSPAKGDRVWVLLETPDHEKGGLYLSDDGGQRFERINGDRELRTRAWYYTHVYADPQDPETVYVNNVSFWRSTNAGKEFSRIPVPHGDCHDLWINPHQPNIMIHANDGGACVSYTGGRSWSSLYNQPTAEIYRVAVDHAFPYRVYGCQQDNSSISVSSAVRGGSSYLMDWIHVGGGEAGHVAVNPQNPNLVYAGEYTGIITRYDRAAGHMQYVTHYPQMHDGLPLHQVKYRFQWNAPIAVSTHDPHTVYHCSQYVHRSRDGGLTWDVISPDLTTNIKEYQELPGGPVQHDYTGVENFTTVFAFAESPLEKGVMMAGSDDGLVHISRDDGQRWLNVTPPGLPRLATVNSIDFSRHKKGKIYVTVHHYRLNDFAPYVFKTEDYGKTWVRIVSGLPADHPTRVVREDPNREGLLYCGTEFGLFASMDDGRSWHPFQLNLPRVPITDLLIKESDLVMSTQGRSFWILDDLTPLHQWRDHPTPALLAPRVAYRTQLGGFWGPGAPEAAPGGAILHFYLPQVPDTSQRVTLTIVREGDAHKRVFSRNPDKKKQEAELPLRAGLNRLIWDLHFNDPVITPGSFFSMASLRGPRAPSGSYTVQLAIGNQTFEQKLTVTHDPRWACTEDDLKEAFSLTVKAVEELNRVHRTIRQLRAIRSQSQALLEVAQRENKAAPLGVLASALHKKVNALEEELVQTRHKAGQDPINYPPKFDDQLAWLVDVVNYQDARPTPGCYDLYRDLKAQSDRYHEQLQALLKEELKLFNDEVARQGLVGVRWEGLR